MKAELNYFPQQKKKKYIRTPVGSGNDPKHTTHTVEFTWDYLPVWGSKLMVSESW